MIFRNERIHLRAPEPDDLDTLFDWENNPSVWKVSGTSSPFSKNTLRNYLDSIHDIFTDKQLRLIIQENNGRPLGCVDLFDFDPMNKRAGVGVLIAEVENRNKGFASDALDIVIEYAFFHLNLHQLYCTIQTSNKNSIKLFTKKGFKQVGTFSDWMNTKDGYEDAIFMQLINHG